MVKLGPFYSSTHHSPLPRDGRHAPAALLLCVQRGNEGADGGPAHQVDRDARLRQRPQDAYLGAAPGKTTAWGQGLLSGAELTTGPGWHKAPHLNIGRVNPESYR